MLDGKEEDFDVVVLAVGFGAEDNKFDLPWNSYWRVDPLDQSLLGESAPGRRAVVVGAGDGALIEIVRSCVQCYDLGALLDQVLAATLGDEALQKEILDIEKYEEGDLLKRYYKLDTDTVRRVRREILLPRHREGAVVTWLVKEEPERVFSCSLPSLPINRFLVGQLRRLSDDYQLGLLKEPCCDVEVKDVVRGERFYVVRFLQGNAERWLECDHAVVRYGAQREPLPSSSAEKRSVLKSIVGAFADTPERIGILQGIAEHYKQLESEHTWTNSKCNRAQWVDDDEFQKPFKKYDFRNQKSMRPELYADAIEGFESQAGDEAQKAEIRRTYRIRIWLKNVPQSLEKVTYHLHYDVKTKVPHQARVVRREALKPRYELWINTWGDYRIRASTNIGLEWELGSVVGALQRNVKKHQRVSIVKGDNSHFDEDINSVIKRLQDQRRADERILACRTSRLRMWGRSLWERGLGRRR